VQVGADRQAREGFEGVWRQGNCTTSHLTVRPGRNLWFGGLLGRKDGARAVHLGADRKDAELCAGPI